MHLIWNPENPDQAKTWQAFHATHHGSLQQSWAYGQALRQLGVEIHRALIMEGEVLLGLAQFQCRRLAFYIGLASCSRGPVWSPLADAPARAQALRLLKKTVPTRAWRATVFSPEQPLAQLQPQEVQGLQRVMTGYSTVVLDLQQPEQVLRAALDGKWRNRLVRAEADSALSTRVEPNLPEARRLLERELQQRKQRRFQGLPTDFVPAYVEAAPSREQGFAVSYAQSRKETQAAMLFLIHGSTATYHIGWSSDAGRQANAHNLLLWRGIEYLRKLGLRRLDLGGANTRALPGITRFKLGTGGQVLTLAGTYY